MKKILYIDYDLQVGHVNFNNIQIDALKATGADVHLVMHKYMYESLPYPRSMYDYIIPKVFRYRNGHSVINRITFIITLILIRLKVSIKHYDYIIIGYCDEISLYLVPLIQDKYIFLHCAAGPYRSSLKRRLCQKISQNNTFLVFNQHMADMLEKAGIDSYRIISHGCVKPFEVNTPVLKTGTFTIYHPSSKLNNRFIQLVLKNSEFQKFIEKNNIQLQLKTCEGVEMVNHSNILYLPNFMPFNDYKKVFVEANAILLSYPESFSGQISGTSYECIANNKKIMVFKHPSLEYCKDFYNYDPMFETADEFIALYEKLINDQSLQCKVSADSLAPNYSFLK